jgi:hypothetical protein
MVTFKIWGFLGLFLEFGKFRVVFALRFFWVVWFGKFLAISRVWGFKSSLV